METTALAIWSDASNNHGNLWTIYILVVSAVLGFSFSEHFSRIVSECHQLAWVALAVLVIFMISNVVSLVNNIEVMSHARDALLEMANSNKKVYSAIQSTSLEKWHVVVLHVVLDLLIFYGLLARIKNAT